MTSRLTYEREQTIESKIGIYYKLKNVVYKNTMIQIRAAIEYNGQIYTLETSVMNSSHMFFCSFSTDGTSHSNYTSGIYKKGDDFMLILQNWLLGKVKSNDSSANAKLIF